MSENGWRIHFKGWTAKGEFLTYLGSLTEMEAQTPGDAVRVWLDKNPWDRAKTAYLVASEVVR